MTDVEDLDPLKFSWAGFLAITSFCSLLFSFFLKLTEGEHVVFFLKAAAASASLSLLSILFKKLRRLT